MLTLSLWAEAQEGGLQDKAGPGGPLVSRGTENSPNACALPEGRDASSMRSLVAAARPESYQKVPLVPQCSQETRGIRLCGA